MARPINTFFPPRSMYRKTPQIIVNNETTIGPWSRPSWITTRPDEKHIHRYLVPTSMVARPDTIAHELYGNSQLDWVLIMFNSTWGNLTNGDVFGWPKAGDTILWPDPSIVIPSL